MLKEQEEKIRNLFERQGFWEVDKIRIRYITDTWVQFSCEKKVVNGPTEYLNVQYTLIDRIKGRSFDVKVESELQQFVSMLKQRNEEIIRLRKKEERLRSLLQS
ncbi:hypothetical protein [Brevibacillus sp. DP1.3A]|uniref:hypothetical protein n=1 Tax=Brevibacillus sp. DP1.3A TaxID=2738867 RepID=UPI00156B40B5|nr:hypothetical protein [Brevibacillus sp. DP1.3A]UED73245.1 hypothetical protein HP399_021235 [Brevibacillus sp. DP1.3A]